PAELTMGILDRLRRRDDDRASATVGGAPSPTADEEPVEEVRTRRLAPDEESTLAAHRARYPQLGIDPADLGSLAAAYERALDDAEGGRAASDAVGVLATAVGDHLVAVAGYRWVMSSDPFGTDLAVEPPGRGVPVVVRTLVAVRWMQRQRGWLVGVAEHLTRAGRR
ncbi:MAG: DUF3806 domain-containing protein, partial [Dermatophilaceae bacterium]